MLSTHRNCRVGALQEFKNNLIARNKLITRKETSVLLKGDNASGTNGMNLSPFEPDTPRPSNMARDHHRRLSPNVPKADKNGINPDNVERNNDERRSLEDEEERKLHENSLPCINLSELNRNFYVGQI